MKGKNQEKRIALDVSKEIHDQFKQYCKSDHRTMTDTFLMWLEDALNKKQLDESFLRKTSI